MTKKYIITDSDVENAFSTTSEMPVQNKIIKAALDTKLDKGATAADVNKVPAVKETSAGSGVYELTLTAIAAQVQADWNQATTTEADYIKNKPFNTIGAGLTVTSGVLSADTQLHFEVMTSLPTASETYKQTIALIARTGTAPNVYDEYACVADTTTTPVSWAWEKLGGLEASVEQTATAIKINGTVLNSATDAQIGLMTKEDHADMQRIANKVTAIAVAASASDDKYPTEKATRTELDLKQDKANLVTAFSATLTDTKYPSEKLVKNSLDGKVDIDTTSSPAFTSLAIGRETNSTTGVTRYYFEDGA